MQNLNYFASETVAARYHLRPTYPAETFDILRSLVPHTTSLLLDIGCGTGNIARNLTSNFSRIDAVDSSLSMLEQGQQLHNGDSPKIRWMHSLAEDFHAEEPYDLITAGESLHWFDWNIVFPKFARILTSNGVLAVLHNSYASDTPWHNDYLQVVKRYSNSQAYVSLDLQDRLDQHAAFQLLGVRKTAEVHVQQHLNDFINAQHARSSLSLESMSAEQAEHFQTDMLAALLPYAKDSILTYGISCEIIYGKPLEVVV